MSWKLRKEVAAGLRALYTAATIEAAEQQVRIIPFFDYPPEIRKVIYTTDAIEW